MAMTRTRASYKCSVKGMAIVGLGLGLGSE
jgi:hypothetical protein